jgi:hypothetical protein
MPDGARPMEKHNPIPFTPEYHSGREAGFTVVTSADGRDVTVEGICPGCEGWTKTTWPTGIGSGQKGIFRGSAKKAEARISDNRRLLFCECLHAHANRPETEPFRGCGATWHVALP